MTGLIKLILCSSLILCALQAAAEPMASNGPSESVPKATLDQAVGTIRSPNFQSCQPWHGVPFDRFGSALARDGNWALIGAPDGKACGTSTEVGKAYLFTKSTSGWTLHTPLMIADLPLGSLFGAAVAIKGDLAVVGAPRQRVSVDAYGAVYVYRLIAGQWQLEQQLSMSGIGLASGFGGELAIHDGDIYVTAFNANSGNISNVGKMFRFVRQNDTWTAAQVLQSPTPRQFGTFGRKPSFVNGQLLIGESRGSNSNGIATGVVHVFENAAGLWQPVAIIQAEDGVVDNMFGDAFTVSGDTMLVGAPSAAVRGMLFAGRIYEFQRIGNQWQQRRQAMGVRENGYLGASVAILNSEFWVGEATASHGLRLERFSRDTVAIDRLGSFTAWDNEDPSGLSAPAEDKFGSTINIQNNEVLVGAPAAASDLNATGAVYAYQLGLSQTNPVEKLTASNLGDMETFGRALAMTEQTVAVGAYNADTRFGHDTGAVYLYDKVDSDWVYRETLLPAEIEAYSRYGDALDMDNETLVVGAPNTHSAENIRSGAVYIFARNGSSWIQQARITSPMPSPMQGFGIRVTVSGAHLFVASADFSTVNYYQIGAVWHYRRVGTEWVFQGMVAPPAPRSELNFGAALDTDGTRLWVTAFKPNAASGSAYAYVWTGSAFEFEADLTPVPLGNGDFLFGRSIAGYGEQAVLGSSSRVYPYRRIGNVWAPETAITADPYEFGFGDALALTANYLITAGDQNCHAFGRTAGVWQALPASTNLTAESDSRAAVAGNLLACSDLGFMEPGVTGFGIVRVVDLFPPIFASGFE